MPAEFIETLIIGGGQAGLAVSANLKARGAPHLIVERGRMVERWRSERWDSLVANGPAWHDRFPVQEFARIDPMSFATRDQIVDYFETFAAKHDVPMRCGVEVKSVTHDNGFHIETSQGEIRSKNLVVATGPFQKPIIPTVVPESARVLQMHSNAYKNPKQLPDGAVLVAGSGSSGSQIADELLRSGRRVYLSVGQHGRPPIRYRGKDFCWWLGVSGQWDLKTKTKGLKSVTIAVSGARGGTTVNFRDYAARGMTLLGRIGAYHDGVLDIADDLTKNIEAGDKSYLGIVENADAYIKANGLDFPEEPEAHIIGPAPDCMVNPIRKLDLKQAGITSIIWATGYAQDFSWLQCDAFDEDGRPDHERGVARLKGLYFLGLPWLSNRSSPFIWGVWPDAEYVAAQIAP